MVFRSVLLMVVLSVLSACSANTFTAILKPFRIDVRQGNAVTPEMLAQLSPGMNREQVRFVMGSPLLVDVFHADRWDYVYQFSHAYKEPERRHVAIFFANDKLLRLEGDVVAATGDRVIVPITPRVIDITGPATPSASPKP